MVLVLVSYNNPDVSTFHSVKINIYICTVEPKPLFIFKNV